MDRLAVMTKVNVDAIRVHRETWWQQIQDAMLVNGGDIHHAKSLDYLMHFLSFFWKVVIHISLSTQIFPQVYCKQAYRFFLTRCFCRRTEMYQLTNFFVFPMCRLYFHSSLHLQCWEVGPPSSCPSFVSVSSRP